MSDIVLPDGTVAFCDRESVRPSRKRRRFRGVITFFVSVSPNFTHPLYYSRTCSQVTPDGRFRVYFENVVFCTTIPSPSTETPATDLGRGSVTNSEPSRLHRRHWWDLDRTCVL